MSDNGRIPAKNLRTVLGGRFRRGAAASIRRMDLDYFADTKRHLAFTSTYRTFNEQKSIFLARYTAQRTGTGPFGDVRYFDGIRYVRTSSAGVVAVPGTSLHGDGRAADFTGNSWDWLEKHSQDYGWIHPDWAKDPRYLEPWHYEYERAKDEVKWNMYAKKYKKLTSKVKSARAKRKRLKTRIAKWNKKRKKFSETP